MPVHSITLTIEGTEANERHLDLSVLAEKFRQFNQLLVSSMKDEERRHCSIRVVNLSHSSPASVTCRITHNGISDAAGVVKIGEMLTDVGSQKTEGISSDFLFAAKKLTADFTSKKIGRAQITVDEGRSKESTVLDLDAKFIANIDLAIDKEYVEISTIDGDLEEINVHNKTYTFKIYNAGVHGKVISCQFPPELLDEAQKALGHGVFISGDFHYKAGDNTPYKIEVSKIELLPPEEDLPSLRDLEGIAPGLTGGKSSVEFVREQRNEWDKER